MKKIGICLIIISLSMVAFYFIYNKSLDNQNIDDVNDYIDATSIVKDITKDEIQNETNNQSKNKNKRLEYTAVLEIPKINLRRGVVDSTKNFSSINYAISVDSNSKYPSENGNFILYAHSGNSNIAFFHNINKLEKEDDIYVYYDGIKYCYKIIRKYDIEKTGKAKVIDLKDDKYITLITCNQQRNGYQIVIEGKLISKMDY